MATEFSIPKDGYLSFDALTLKQYIKDRLNETNIFTDQNYEGSYISTINEIIAYSFHTLLYYLNQTATNSEFSETTVYDAMNRIVKLLDYKPIGRQTSTLTFQMSAGTNFSPGLFTIPRYSYIENGARTYAFNEDIVFAKTEAAGTIEALTNVTRQKLLYQGRYREFPLYTAVGNDNEIIYFTPGDNIIIDHFNIDVYVQNDSNWSQWHRVQSLYNEDAFSDGYEIRFNENKQYEIKFGNGINGRKLAAANKVAIYYLQSTGTDGEVGVNALQGRKIIPFSTTTFNQIVDSINDQASTDIAYIDTLQAKDIYFDNSSISTYYQEEESIESIKQNAPGIFRSQYRLITEQDYENYIRTNFANLIHDVSVVNNWTYLQEQVKYYYEIGLQDPNNVSNLLYNQVLFADGCNFNNVYFVIVPKTISETKNPTTNLTPAQKELIITGLRSLKTLTSESIVLDPVYIASNVCLTVDGSADGTLEDIENTELHIIKDPNSRRDTNSIALDVETAFTDYFSRDNVLLGQEFDLSTLTNNILAVDGVKTFYTQRTDQPSVRYNGLSMLLWNPVYPSDRVLTTKNASLEYFKFLYLDNKEHFSGKIVVESETTIYETIEY